MNEDKSTTKNFNEMEEVAIGECESHARAQCTQSVALNKVLYCSGYRLVLIQ